VQCGRVAVSSCRVTAGVGTGSERCKGVNGVAAGKSGEMNQPRQCVVCNAKGVVCCGSGRSRHGSPKVGSKGVCAGGAAAEEGSNRQ